MTALTAGTSPTGPAPGDPVDRARWAGAVQSRSLLVALVPILVAAVVFGLYFQAQPHWLADPDAQDYAQLGRQIAAGRGASTLYMPVERAGVPVAARSRRRGG